MDRLTLQQEIVLFEQDATLCVETNLAARVRALQTLNLFLNSARWWGSSPELASWVRRAHALQQQLVAQNRQLFHKIRAQIQSGRLAPQALGQLFRQYVSSNPAHVGPDGLDALLEGVLEIETAPQPVQPSDPEMLHYEPTPARIVLELVARVEWRPGDKFYDLGSGLGQVPILVHLLTRVPACGVEIEPAYHAFALQCARKLGLERVVFQNRDARDADFSEGTVFFLFTPFRGALLQRVLERLRQVAQQHAVSDVERPAVSDVERHAIQIGSYGPCTAVVARQPWLCSLDGTVPDEFHFALFRGGGADASALS